MRDITLEDTFRHQFTTRAFATGVPTALAGTPVLSVLEENNATPITAGVTVSVDRASVVGFNEATVIATAANGYETGKSYAIYISTGTVGGVSVIGEVVGQFTIQLAPVNWARVTAPTTAVDLSGTDIQLVDTTTVNTDMVGTDSALLAASAPTNFGDLSITITTGLVSVGTNNDKTGYSISGTITTLDGLNNFAPATDVVASVTLVATTTTNTDMRGTDSAALASVATEARLSELDEATAGKMANQVDIIQVDTTTDIPALIAALNDISVADILTTQMTEAFAADGVAPTLAQALFLIQQILGDFSIAGTTLTVRKIDGVTTAATFTLDDDTNPTDLTRAT